MKYFVSLVCFITLYSITSTAQNLKHHYDSANRIHFDVPGSWEVNDKQPNSNVGNFIYIFSCHVVSSSYHDDNIASFHVCYFVDPMIYFKQDDNHKPFFKTFTTSPQKKHKYLSDRYRSSFKYEVYNNYLQDDHRHQSFKRYPAKNMCFRYIHNDTIFTIRFFCMANKYKKYKPLFLKIANSVYFD